MSSSNLDINRMIPGDLGVQDPGISTARLNRKMRVSIKGLVREVETSGYESVEEYLRQATSMTDRQINEYLAYLSIYSGDLQNGVYESISKRLAMETVQLLEKMGISPAY